MSAEEKWAWLEKNFACCICLGVQVLPVEFKPCAHTLCLDCAKDLLHTQDRHICPICRGRIRRVEDSPQYRYILYTEVTALACLQKVLRSTCKEVRIYSTDSLLAAVV
jgi:hypothetical protein